MLCFEQKYEKYRNFYLKFFSFLEVKVSTYLNRRVFVMNICTAAICFFVFFFIFNICSMHEKKIHAVTRQYYITTSRYLH